MKTKALTDITRSYKSSHSSIYQIITNIIINTKQMIQYKDSPAAKPLIPPIKKNMDKEWE
jgi:hypothetical protein